MDRKSPTAMDDKELVRALKALADLSRLQMVHEVAEAGELSCGDLGKCFNVSQPTVSHHLKILSEAGVLLTRAEGKHHFISVNHALLDQLSGIIPARFPRRKKEVGARD